MSQNFEYKAITIRVKGGSVLSSIFQEQGVDQESVTQLQKLGHNGWELTAVIPVTLGSHTLNSTPFAICFLKRATTHSRQEVSRCGVAGSATPDSSYIPSDSITGEQFDVLIARERMKKECASGNYWLTADDWNYITVNRVPEALPAIERRIALLTPEENSDELRTQLLTFYSLLRPEEATESLYKLAGQAKCFDKVHRIINGLGLFSVRKLTEMLESPNRETRLNALHLVWTQKAQYTSEDAGEYQELAAAVVKAFPPADAFEKKGLLGKVKRVWKCTNCRAEIDEGIAVCECGSDRNGISSEHRGLRVVLDRLERRKAILQSGQFDS